MKHKEQKTYLKIAWRNVIRNKRRTFLTVLSIIFGSSALILFGGFAEATYEGLRESTIHSRLGHIQITKRGFREKGNLRPDEYSIHNYDEILKSIEGIKEIEFVTKRVEFNGLLATDETSITFMATGVDADIDRKINTFVKTVAGQPPSDSEPSAISIGIGLSDSLDLKPGSDLTLMSSYGETGLNAIDFSVSGVFQSGIPDYDNTAVTVPIESAWQLLGTEDVHKIVILLRNTDDTAKVKAELVNIFRENNFDLEVKTWEDLASFYQKVKMLYGSIFGFITLVVIFVVLFSIANTITMSVFERIREIGSIRAIGTTKRGIITLFLMEGAYIGIIGGITGVTLGAAMAFILSNSGIMMPPPPGFTVGYPLTLQIVPSLLAQVFFLAFITSVCSAILPARKASKLNIVEALSYV